MQYDQTPSIYKQVRALKKKVNEHEVRLQNLEKVNVLATGNLTSTDNRYKNASAVAALAQNTKSAAYFEKKASRLDEIRARFKAMQNEEDNLT